MLPIYHTTCDEVASNAGYFDSTTILTDPDVPSCFVFAANQRWLHSIRDTQSSLFHLPSMHQEQDMYTGFLVNDYRIDNPSDPGWDPARFGARV